MKLKYLKPDDYHIYVDLDGVLANLQDYIEEVIGEPVRTAPNGSDWIDSDRIWKELRRLDEPDFSQLELLPDAMTLWEYVLPHNPNILTATGHPAERNDKQKRQWVEEMLTGYDKIYTVVASRNKAKFAWPDAVLIDDRMKSIGPWREKGGIGILHKNAEDTIDQLKELGL